MAAWKSLRTVGIAAVCVAAFSLAGCAGPHPVDPTRPPTLDARDVLEFDIRGRHVALRSVTFTGDSVSGVPWQYPTDPRVSYLVANISQVKVTRAHEGNTGVVKFVWVTLVGLGLFLLLLRQLLPDT